MPWGGGPLRGRHVTHNFIILMILIISDDDMTVSPILFASSSTCRAPSTSYRTFHKLSRLILHHYACVDNSCDCLAQLFILMVFVPMCFTYPMARNLRLPCNLLDVVPPILFFSVFLFAVLAIGFPPPSLDRGEGDPMRPQNDPQCNP